MKQTVYADNVNRYVLLGLRLKSSVEGSHVRPDQVYAELLYRRREVLTQMLRVRGVFIVATEQVDDDLRLRAREGAEEVGQRQNPRKRFIHLRSIVGARGRIADRFGG